MRINNEKNLRRSGLRGLSFTGVYLEGSKSTHHTKIYSYHCVYSFTMALCTEDRKWNQLRWPSSERWIKKMWCMHTVDYEAIRKN